MKVVAVILLAFAAFGVLESAPLGDENLADIVQKLIDQVLSGIPDDLSIKDIKIDIPQNDIENGEIVITEISIVGLKKLDTKLKYDEKTSTLNFTLNYPDVAVVVDFTINLKGLLNLDHHLSVHVDLDDLKNEGYAVVNVAEKEVEKFDLLLTLGKSVVDIKGLLNNDELSKQLSKFLTENVAAVLNTIDPILEPYFSYILKEIINIALKL